MDGRAHSIRSRNFALMWPSRCSFSRQFDDVRRKARFMATKIVPSTSNRGITPGPKLMASPIIHKRMASVKIVQNTALLLSWRLPKILQFAFRLCGPKIPSVVGFDSARVLTSENNLLTVLIQKRALQVVWTLIPKKYFAGVDPPGPLESLIQSDCFKMPVTFLPR